MSEVPPSWRALTLGEVSTRIRNGIFARRPSNDPPGTPILRISAVKAGRVELSDVKYVENVTSAQVDDFRVQKGDILVTRYNGSRHLVGISGIVGEVERGVLHPDKLIKVSLADGCDPRFVNYQLASAEARAHIEPLIRTTAGQSGISGPSLRSTPLLLPSMDEQRRIVAVLEDHLSRLDAADAYLADAQRRGDALVRAHLRSSLRQPGTWDASLSDVCGPASPPKAVVAAKSYLDEGSWPVVDQGEGDVGGYTEDEDAVYRGELPIIVFGDHTRRIKFVDRPFAVGAQGTKLLRAKPGIEPRFAFWTLKDVDLSARGYGRHYALLRVARPRMATAERQRAIVASMDDAINEQASLQTSLDVQRARCAALRRALLTAAFTGHLTGRSSDMDIAEELAEATT